MVGPRVAAAAAQRALEVLVEEDPANASEAQAAVSEIDSARTPSDGPISALRMRTAAAAALAAAAVR